MKSVRKQIAESIREETRNIAFIQFRNVLWTLDWNYITDIVDDRVLHPIERRLKQ